MVELLGRPAAEDGRPVVRGPKRKLRNGGRTVKCDYKLAKDDLGGRCFPCTDGTDDDCACVSDCGADECTGWANHPLLGEMEPQEQP